MSNLNFIARDINAPNKKTKMEMKTSLNHPHFCFIKTHLMQNMQGRETFDVMLEKQKGWT